MAHITPNMTLRDIARLPQLAAYGNYIKYNGYDAGNDLLEADAEFDVPLCERSPNGAMIQNGANFLLDLAEKGRASLHRVYADEERRQAPRKADVNVVRLVPDDIDPAKPYILLCSGGAYICVCNHVEAYPTAAHFVKAGYQVFVLTYTVRIPGSLPAALSDVAAAIRYIKEHEREFELDGGNYAIGGYSAGGNLIATWGTAKEGYKAFGLPKPRAMFPIYPVVDFFDVDIPDADDSFMVYMLGKDITAELVSRYNVLSLIDGEYPPCYIVCGKDDETVPPSNSERMKERLDAVGVPAILEMADRAPHGFGDGTGFEVEGWPKRAIAFLERHTSDG